MIQFLWLVLLLSLAVGCTSSSEDSSNTKSAVTDGQSEVGDVGRDGAQQNQTRNTLDASSVQFDRATGHPWAGWGVGTMVHYRKRITSVQKFEEMHGEIPKKPDSISENIYTVKEVTPTSVVVNRQYIVDGNKALDQDQEIDLSATDTYAHFRRHPRASAPVRVPAGEFECYLYERGEGIENRRIFYSDEVPGGHVKTSKPYTEEVLAVMKIVPGK